MALSEKDSELASQAKNFAAVLAGDPERYGQSVAAATAVSTAVAAFLDSYQTLILAREGGVRSECQTATKDADRQSMLDLLRPIYLAVQASTVIAEADKVALGVHVKRARHTVSPAPAVAPLVSVTRVDGSVVSLRIRNPETPFSSARPAKTEGIAVFCYVGEQAPTDAAAFRFVGTTGKTTIRVPVGPNVPAGATVWFSAIFFNGSKQMGPASAAVRTTVGVGSIMPELKLAA